MTHANRFKTKGARGAVVLAAAAMLGTGALGALPLGCSTEDEIIFSTKCVAGRCNEDPAGATSGATSGGSVATTDCPDKDVVDPNCPLWASAIFTQIIDEGAAGNCAGSGCHSGIGASEPVLVPGNAKATRVALLTYQFENPAGPYVSCENPDSSKILCNLSNENTCGLPMPQGSDLTQPQIDLIKEWITCGAPDN